MTTTAATQVVDVAGYLALVEDRLRSEGFTVVRGARVADYPVKLVATRRGGGLRESDSLVLLFSTQEDLSPRGVEQISADTLIPFCLGALDAHAPADGGGALLRGRTIVVPVTLTRVGPAPQLARALGALHLQRGSVAALPAVVDLTQAAVHLLRRHDELGRGGERLVSYVWWLLAPRLIERPRTRTRWTPLRRILVAAGLGAAVLFGGVYVYMRMQPAARSWLVYAVDPATGHIAYLRYIPAWDDTKLVVLDANGSELSRRTVPGDTFLCELRGDTVTLLSCGARAERCKFRRDRVDRSAREELFAGGKMGCPRLSPDGTSYVFEEDAARVGPHLELRAADGSPLPAPFAQPRDGGAVWFPAGASLLVSAGPEGAQHLVIVDTAAGTRRDVTPAGSRDIKPAIAPDGQRAACYRISRRTYDEAGSRRDTSAVGDLTVIDLRDGSARLLLQDVCLSSPPAWLDADTLIYGGWVKDQCELFRYDLRAGETRRLPSR